MRIWIFICLYFVTATIGYASKFVQTPYKPQKVVFEFYFNEPSDINAALFRVRSLMNPLSESPYDLMPEDLNIKIVLHGTEIVTVAKKNKKKYNEVVGRMRYYADAGV